MIYALDGLGAAMYQSAYVKAITLKLGHGGFAEEFGPFFPVAQKCLGKGSPHGRYHLVWNKNHVYGDKDIPAIIRLAKQYNKLAAQHETQVVELSPFCERLLFNPDTYLDIARENAPDCVIVNSPAGQGALSSKYKNEVHGGANHPLKGAYNYSGDGGATVNGQKRDFVDLDVTNLKVKHSNSDVFFIWACGLNCHWSITDTSRTFKPDDTYLQSLIYLATAEGQISVPHNWTIKSHAEASPDNAKSNKLMIISPVKASKITLKRNGKVIENLAYYEPYTDGRFRYYSPRYGFKDGAGCEVWANGQKYGICNPGFRTN